MGISALSSVSGNAWNYVKAMGQAAKETVKDFDVKDVAAFWTGKDAKDVTRGDIAKTFAAAAVPYVALAGCEGSESKAIIDQGKTGKPSDVTVTLGEGFGTQTFNNLEGQKRTILLTGYIKTPPLEKYDGFVIKAGTLNYKAANEKLIPDLTSCDPKSGHIEGCDPASSCRVLYAGIAVAESAPDVAALSVVDDTDLISDLFVDPNAPDGGRQLLVKSNGNKYLSTNAFSPLAGDKGATVSNVPWSFNGTSFGSNPPEWAKPIDPAACDFAAADVLKFFTGVDGAQAYGWESYVSKDANYGQLLGSDVVPKPAPITIKSFYIEHVKFPGKGYLVQPQAPNNIFGDLNGANAFEQKVPKNTYCAGLQPNCMDYFEGPFWITLELDGTHLSEQNVKDVLSYITLGAGLE